MLFKHPCVMVKDEGKVYGCIIPNSACFKSVSAPSCLSAFLARSQI